MSAHAVAGFDQARVRSLFPAAGAQVLLNNASYGPLPTPVVEAITRHAVAQSRLPWNLWNRALAAPALERLERFLGAPRDTLTFMHTTTAGIVHLASTLRLEPGDVVLVPNNEYPATVLPWRARAEADGIQLELLEATPFPTGGVPIEVIAAALARPRVKVLTLSVVNWLGYRYALPEIAALCAERDVVLALDASQALGMVEVGLPRCPLLFLTAAFYKWGFTPEGIAITHCSPELRRRMKPAMLELKSVAVDEADLLGYQLRHPREPILTGPAPLCFVALQAGLDLHLELGAMAVEAHNLALAASLAEGLEDAGYRSVSDSRPAHRSAIVMFSHRDPARNADLRAHLLARDIFVCSRAGALRAAVHAYNDRSDLERLVGALEDFDRR